MLDFNLEYYRAFYYTIKLGGFTKAANALYLSQPAISYSIQKLEEYMGCQLIDRINRRIALTEEGRALYEQVSKALEMLALTEQKIRRSEKFRAGTITISTSETPLQMVILPALTLFKKNNPDIFINIIGSGSSSFSAEHLNQGEADIALGIMPSFEVQDADLYYGPTAESIAVVNKSYALISKPPLSASDLAQYDIICSDPGSSARALLDTWFLEHGIIFKPTYSVKTTFMILSLAEQGLGIGIIPRSFSDNLLFHEKLKKIDLSDPLPNRTVVMATSRKSKNKDLCKIFTNHLLNQGLIQKQ